MKHAIYALGLVCLAGLTSARAEETAAAPKAAAAPAPAAAPAVTPAAVSKKVRVTTNVGAFVIELNAERAPLSVANFLRYVDEGQYTGTVFHRVVANFVIQGGGYDSSYKLKAAPHKVVNEAGNGLSNSRGSVGMARASDPHGGDCQFYVNLADNGALDPNASRWGYAVFGSVVEGMEIVDQIGNVATGARGSFKEDAPLKLITIEKIERIAEHASP
jgi:cyclophilin family peptidyl-prolyl cis-trans isomerase